MQSETYSLSIREMEIKSTIGLEDASLVIMRKLPFGTESDSKFFSTEFGKKEPWKNLSVVHQLDVKGELFPVLIIPQVDEGFVARILIKRFSATGQGKTPEEALRDIKSAIELLTEEEANPSGDVPWPEDYR